MKKTIAVIVFALTALVLASGVSASTAFPLDPAAVNTLDRTFMCPYDKTMDDVSLAFCVAALASPAVLVSESPAEYPTIAVMYAESLAISYGTKELFKYLISRERPYMYYADTPMDMVESDEHNESFFSGHTIAAFTGAAFTSYVFAKYNPDSAWRIPVTVASFALASATAAFRVASGNHFMTDVLAGAVLGTAIGIAVPALHTLFADNDTSVSVSPFGLVFSRSY